MKNPESTRRFQLAKEFFDSFLCGRVICDEDHSESIEENKEWIANDMRVAFSLADEFLRAEKLYPPDFALSQPRQTETETETETSETETSENKLCSEFYDYLLTGDAEEFRLEIQSIEGGIIAKVFPLDEDRDTVNLKITPYGINIIPD